ncbi:MAG: tetratricopeptide repeat protein [Helicobacteraceae bacterium]|jgi:tetratricopeptide (TPR) repeat protein|nr:tetratricopeptide repeat protein [Helicobacteraceae bacterium]
MHSTPSRRFFLTARKFAFLIAITVLLFSNVCGANNNFDTFIDSGNKALEAGDFQTAVSEFTKAIKIDPNFAGAYSSRGDAYYELDDYNKAIADFTKAIKINQNFAEAYNGRGKAYRHLGDYNKAIADFTKAIKIDPNYGNAYEGRGLVYYRLGDYNNASKDARKACDLYDCILFYLMKDKNLLRK